MGYLVQWQEWVQRKTSGLHYHVESEGLCLAGVDSINEGFRVACNVMPTMGEVTGPWHINMLIPGGNIDDHDTCLRLGTGQPFEASLEHLKHWQLSKVRSLTRAIQIDPSDG